MYTHFPCIRVSILYVACMHACMRVLIFTCRCGWQYVCIHTYRYIHVFPMHACIHSNVYVHMHAYIHIHTYIRAYACKHMHACICTYICVFVYLQMRMRVHIYLADADGSTYVFTLLFMHAWKIHIHLSSSLWPVNPGSLPLVFRFERLELTIQASETKIKLPYHSVCCSVLQRYNTGKPHSLVWPVLHRCNTLQHTKWYVSFVYVSLAQMVSSHSVCCSVVQ